MAEPQHRRERVVMDVPANNDCGSSASPALPANTTVRKTVPQQKRDRDVMDIRAILESGDNTSPALPEKTASGKAVPQQRQERHTVPPQQIWTIYTPELTTAALAAASAMTDDAVPTAVSTSQDYHYMTSAEHGARQERRDSAYAPVRCELQSQHAGRVETDEVPRTAEAACENIEDREGDCKAGKGGHELEGGLEEREIKE